MKYIFYFFILSLTSSYAQKKISTVKLNEEIVSATVDRVGELYAVTKSGGIQKYDTNGKLLSSYKSGQAPTLFEPRDGSRLFAYFKNDRRIDYMNPSFEPTSSYKIDSAFVIEPWLVCSSGDYQFWTIDAADWTLKKIDPRTSTLLVDVKLPDDVSSNLSDINTIREYQGFLFLLYDLKGIYIFNGMGKWIKTISVPHLKYFNFLGEELYYPAATKTTFFNLFSGETREVSTKNLVQIALFTDERRFEITERAIDFFEFKP